MIFVTVGTQLPFPRLLDAMDAIAARRPEPVIAQSGETRGWSHLTAQREFAMGQMTKFCVQARVIVAHAGIGTVLAARKAMRPLIVLPRQAGLGEHRNDHQIATATALEAQAGVWVAWTVADLARLIDADLDMSQTAQAPLQDSLICAVRDFALT